jgi:hypothetical protein
MMIAALLTTICSITASAGEPPAPGTQDNTPSLPFTIKITETIEVPETKHIYYSDFPGGLAVIEGDLWFIGKNGDGPHVIRKKGKDFEDLKAQPGGKGGTGSGAQPHGGVLEAVGKGKCNRPYILGGIWHDATENRIYAPLHCEYFWNKWAIQRQIHLASSADLGLTWTYEGPILLNTYPHSGDASAPLETRCAEWSGAMWDAGDGDHHLFTDEKTGYHYVFSNHYIRKKPGVGKGGGLCSRHHVARCAISDKMASDKWRKFYHGKWEEPAIGGKGSYVNGYCVTYNTYLKKYLSFDWVGGVAACDDIEKQDWTPIFKIPDASWGFGDERGNLAWFVTNEEKTEQNRTGRVFYVYSGFSFNKSTNASLRIPVRHRIELGPGETHPTQGFSASGIGGWETGGGPSANPDLAYPGPAFLDSPDPIESRRTVAPQPSEVTYQGEWKAGASDKPGSAVRCTFKAKEIYYRNQAGPGFGKVDIFLDGAWMKTSDCWSHANHSSQFGFIATHLDPNQTHTLEIRVRGDKHPLSTGTMIRAGAFEYSANCYRVSDCFSSIQGKNQWRYCQKKDGRYADMTWADPGTWTGDGKCAIGSDYQTPDVNEVARTWTAPRDGVVRLEGRLGDRDKVQWDPLVTYVERGATDPVSPAKQNQGANILARILKNGETLWSAELGSATHDFHTNVKAGDIIAFSTKLLGNEVEPKK